MAATTTQDRDSRSPSPPTITRTRSPTYLPNIPTTNLVRAAAEAAHYSTTHHVSRSETIRASFGRGISEDGLPEGRKRVLEDVKELFCSRPSIEIFERSWRIDAVFEDPLSKCVGFKEYAPQWFAMPKIFAKSETLSSQVLASTTQPNQLIYSQRQEYTLRLFKTKKIIQSFVVIDLDDEDKIIKLDDRWNGEEQSTTWPIVTLRRMNARVLPWLVSAK